MWGPLYILYFFIYITNMRWLNHEVHPWTQREGNICNLKELLSISEFVGFVNGASLFINGSTTDGKTD